MNAAITRGWAELQVASALKVTLSALHASCSVNAAGPSRFRPLPLSAEHIIQYLAVILRRFLAAEGRRFEGRDSGEMSCHSLRHTFAMRYLRTGSGDVRALRKILGHASLTTTQRYVDHLEFAELAEDMPALPRVA